MLRGAKQCIGTLALALEPNILMNSISMSWQCVCLLLKSYIVDVDDQVAMCFRCRVVPVMVLPRQLGHGAM
jgi:hypothetical protein